jgi:XTP/dITP diphosphohydrolase
VDIVFATHNAHKRGEVEAIMKKAWPKVSLVAPKGEPPIEDGSTFAENALIKARAAFVATGIASIADDSGICVDALGGEPGIHSARYSGSGDDRENLDLLLKNLEGIDERRAYFVCVAAFVDHDGEHTIEKRWHGQIARSAHGGGGFGYDPIFEPQGLGKTAAELSSDEKNEISHRGQAFVTMASFLRDRFGI